MNKMEKAANLLVVLAAVSIIGMNVYDRFAPREDIRQMRAKALGGSAPMLLTK
jgi:hypothetical protein